jgi:hypothetical protein
MSRQKRRLRSGDEVSHALDRRVALERMVLGGAGLAVTAVSGVTGTAASQQAQPQKAGEPPWIAGRIRRVVTGHNAQGRSCVISDEMVNIKAEAGSHNLWITSAEEPFGAVRTPIGQAILPVAALAGEPHSGLRPSNAPVVDPPIGGVRWTVAGHLPTTGAERPATNNRVGRHRSATIDFAFVLGSGLVCVLDEQEVKLNLFDLIIQRNTDHAWRNDGKENVPFLSMIVRVNG